MKKWYIVLRVVAFCVLFCLLFYGISELMIRKSISGAWDMTNKVSGFYNEPQNEFDVMFFGSSNTYCSFMPTVLWEQTGVYSYVFATQRQPLSATYSYIKEALKYQSPRLIVMDVLTVEETQEYLDAGVNHSAADDIRMGKEKVEMCLSLAPGKESLELLLPFIKYHVRWKELQDKDYAFRRNSLRDPLKGYVLLDNTYDKATYVSQKEVTECKEISEKNARYLQKIIDLCRERKIELLLVKTPNNETTEQRKLFNTARQTAEKNGVRFINFNDHYDAIGLDTSTDFYDATHLNYKGAEKFSKYFAEMLSLTPSADQNKTAAQWQRDAATLREKIRS